MINNEIKQIVLPEVTEDEKKSFRLETRYGRDALAERIEQDINEWCKQRYDDGPRSHLGASVIGHNCERFIWFGFRWMFKERFTGRQQRLFQRGHLEETRIIEWLTGIGFRIHSVNEDGKQFRIVFGEGHGGGSTDGVGILPTRYSSGLVSEFPPLLLEFKTQKDKQFAKLQGSGVEKEKPRHFVQASVYGRQLGIHYCLYIAVNKEDDDLDVEVIELDWGLAEAELTKAERIINLQYPPPRISNNPTFWECKYCPALPVCHLNAAVPINCRSCRYAEAMPNKAWQCNYHHAMIPSDFIAKGCNQHLPLTR